MLESNINYKVHERTWRFLLSSVDDNENEIGDFLSKVRRVRNHVNYDKNHDFDYFFAELQNIQSKIENVVDSILYLRNNPNRGLYMDELNHVEMLINDSKLFDDEFNNLKSFYTFDNEKEIFDFVKIHPGIIVLLNAYENSLKKFFSNAIFELKFD